MPGTVTRTFAAGVRLFLSRALRRAAGRLAPRDPSYLASRLERGDVVWQAFLQAGQALIATRRFEDADRTLARALAAFPGDPDFLIDHATGAHNSGRYAIAIDRWTKALEIAPDRPMCHAGLAANLRMLGRDDPATRTIEAALVRFPGDLLVIGEAARCAEHRGRFEDARALWDQACATSDPHPDWLRGLAHALVILGRFDEAEAVLAPALRKHPQNQLLLAVEAILASAREDHPKAIALWTAFRDRFPDDKTGWEHLGRALQAERLDYVADPRAKEIAPAPAPPSVERVSDESIRDLLLGFESIGDNCEFGSVQRRYGAEPLGLLRWNTVTIEGLVAALNARFAGYGEPDQAVLTTNWNGEFMIADRRWGLAMHTFLFEAQTDAAALHPKMCRRMVYLRDKFLGDLAAGAKTFVYRMATYDHARIERLHAALRAHGPAKLLVVVPAASHSRGAAGTIVALGADLTLGFLGRLGIHEGGFWDIAFDDWVAVCRATRA